MLIGTQYVERTEKKCHCSLGNVDGTDFLAQKIKYSVPTCNNIIIKKQWSCVENTINYKYTHI